MSVRIEIGAEGHSILFDGLAREDVKRVAVIVDPEDKTAVLRVVKRAAAGELVTSDFPLEPGVIDVSVLGTKRKLAGRARGEGQRSEGKKDVPGGGSE